ncbi:hypothetical protein ACRRTK_021612 [Alexandromys fortis]
MFLHFLQTSILVILNKQLLSVYSGQLAVDHFRKASNLITEYSESSRKDSRKGILLLT